MAEGKKSFVLYCDLIHTVSKMTSAKAGDLFKTILSYVNDENPEVKDMIVALVFEPIKQQLKRDLKDWENTRHERSEAGKVGAAKRWQKMAKDGTAINPMAKMAVTVNDTVTDTVRENTPLVEFRIEECLTVAMNDDRWVKANKATIKDLQEFNELLERRGHYTKNPADYKSHFHNWKAGGKKENFIDSKEPVQNLNGHLTKL